MRQLQADVGNTALKWRLLENEVELGRGQCLLSALDSPDGLPEVATALDAVWVASVAADELEGQLEEKIHARYGVTPHFATTPARSASLINSYREPQRMGVDRWLAMLGARARCQQRLCVVDAGSAMTIDLVSANGQHEGGFILPGLALMERALLADTGRVRFDGPRHYALAPGEDTRSAVHNGAALAQVGAVNLALARAAQNGPLPRLFLCGGDGHKLISLLAAEAQFCEDLVFEGLSVYTSEQDTGAS